MGPLPAVTGGGCGGSTASSIESRGNGIFAIGSFGRFRRAFDRLQELKNCSLSNPIRFHVPDRPAIYVPNWGRKSQSFPLGIQQQRAQGGKRSKFRSLPLLVHPPVVFQLFHRLNNPCNFQLFLTRKSLHASPGATFVVGAKPEVTSSDGD